MADSGSHQQRTWQELHDKMMSDGPGRLHDWKPRKHPPAKPRPRSTKSGDTAETVPPVPSSADGSSDAGSRENWLRYVDRGGFRSMGGTLSFEAYRRASCDPNTPMLFGSQPHMEAINFEELAQLSDAKDAHSSFARPSFRLPKSLPTFVKPNPVVLASKPTNGEAQINSSHKSVDKSDSGDTAQSHTDQSESATMASYDKHAGKAQGVSGKAVPEPSKEAVE